MLRRLTVRECFNLALTLNRDDVNLVVILNLSVRNLIFFLSFKNSTKKTFREIIEKPLQTSIWEFLIHFYLLITKSVEQDTRKYIQLTKNI